MEGLEESHLWCQQELLSHSRLFCHLSSWLSAGISFSDLNTEIICQSQEPGHDLVLAASGPAPAFLRLINGVPVHPPPGRSEVQTQGLIDSPQRQMHL